MIDDLPIHVLLIGIRASVACQDSENQEGGAGEEPKCTSSPGSANLQLGPWYVPTKEVS
jgi:hypothetical protein